jgi:xanthine dehydrogenase YagR molybdenum-binding subunit
VSLLQTVFEVVAKILPDKDADPLLESKRIVGQPISRLDGVDKVTGQAQYTAEIAPDRLAHASLVCSRIALGTIVDIDLGDAERAPGVLGVLTHRNAPRMKEAPLLLYLKGASFTHFPVMQDARVRWNGEPVAVVVAETKEQADYAASLVRVTYEEEKARLDFDAHKHRAVRPADVLGQPPAVIRGDAEGALRTADIATDAVYRTPRHSHAAIELHATTAEWREDGLIVHDATQAISLTRTTLAKVFGLKKEQVRVVSRLVGGGFGNKMAWNHQSLCVAAAQLVKRPVRLVLSRKEVFLATGGRTLSEQRVALAARRDGRLTGVIHTGVTATGMKRNGFAEQFSFPARHLYAAETFHIEQRVLELDTVANASMRAPGESIGGFALESAIDELAFALGMDPIELRRRNQPVKDPTKGTPFSARNLMAALDLGAERFGWKARNPVPRSTREGEWWVGQGVASAFYPYQRFPGAKVSIKLCADGRAIVRTGAHEMGMGTATAQSQLVAERLGLPLDAVIFQHGDSDLPDAAPGAGSAQTASITAAVIPAAEAIFKELLKLAGRESPLAGKKLGEIEARDSGLFVKGGRDGETYTALLTRAGREHVQTTATAPLPFEMMKYSMHSYGGQFCEVRVNDVTGEVRVSRWVAVFDTGRIINPKMARSQFCGGIVMGLGAALTEEAVVDARHGRVLNCSLAEYHVPVHADVPEIDVSWLDKPDPLAPMGAKGVGEIGITGVAAAVANAVFHATGKRIRTLPITPSSVLTTEASPSADAFSRAGTRRAGATSPGSVTTSRTATRS